MDFFRLLFLPLGQAILLSLLLLPLQQQLIAMSSTGPRMYVIRAPFTVVNCTQLTPILLLPSAPSAHLRIETTSLDTLAYLLRRSTVLRVQFWTRSSLFRSCSDRTLTS